VFLTTCICEYIHNIYTIYTQYIHNIYTIYTQYIHNIYTIYSQYIHNIYTIYSQYIHNIFTIYTQYIHCIIGSSFISVALKSWSAQKLLSPTAYVYLLMNFTDIRMCSKLLMLKLTSIHETNIYLFLTLNSGSKLENM
jgi:hypothetical protein